MSDIVRGLTAEELQEAARLAGRLYAARRTTVASACAYCGVVIVGTTRRRYCSDVHRVADNRRRKAHNKEPPPP